MVIEAIIKEKGGNPMAKKRKGKKKKKNKVKGKK